jgi:hypothetical protein
VGCGAEPTYRKVIRSALLSSDGWDSLLLAGVQAFEYENCASDYPIHAEFGTDEYQ